MAAEPKKRGWKKKADIKPAEDEDEPKREFEADEKEPRREVKVDEKRTDERRRASLYDHPRSKPMKREARHG